MARRPVHAAADLALEAAARDALARGDVPLAVRELHAILLTAHEATSLPCLCRRCIATVGTTANAEGIRFVLDVVVARSHALFFWVPEELASSPKALRSSMRTELRGRLRRRAARGRRRLPPASNLTP